MDRIDKIMADISSPYDIIDYLIRLSFDLQGISEVLALMDGNKTPGMNILHLLHTDLARISNDIWQYCEALLQVIKMEEHSVVIKTE